GEVNRAMKPRVLAPGSTGRWPVVRGSLPRTALDIGRAITCRCIRRSGRMLQAGSLCFPELGARRRATTMLKIFISVLIAYFAEVGKAITLGMVLQTTLEKNPAIAQAKAGLEEAAGQRLILRSIMWPDAKVGVPGGVQGGHRAGESATQAFAFARGSFVQSLFNAAAAPSRRRGDVGLLIAEQQLNVAVVEQLHAARLAFYTALYNRSLESLRREQQRRLQENVTAQRTRFEAGLTDKTALASATVQASELDTRIEGAHRTYLDARLQLALVMGI